MSHTRAMRSVGVLEGRGWVTRLHALAAAAFLLAVALACKGGSRSGSTLEYGSETDVEKLLAANGAPVSVHDCVNVRYGDGGDPLDPGPTRALSCFTTLTSAQSSALVASLALTTAKPSTSSGGPRTGTCGGRGFVVGASGYDAYQARGRPKTAPGWEYVVVIVESATGRTCVELEYAWS